jgi:hypothetical protein
MKKSASKTIKLTKCELTITITRSITEIKGDAWEGRPDETLYIEDVSISFLHPVSGKNEVGKSIRKYDPSNPFDSVNIKKGAVGEVRGTGLMLAQASYDQVVAAYAEISAEAMYPEWQARLDSIATKNKAEKIARAKEVVEEAEKEMSGGKKLMTEAEIKDWNRNYNNILNEGGSGFIPSHTSSESYENAKKTLTEMGA